MPKWEPNLQFAITITGSVDESLAKIDAAREMFRNADEGDGVIGSLVSFHTCMAPPKMRLRFRTRPETAKQLVAAHKHFSIVDPKDWDEDGEPR